MPTTDHAKSERRIVALPTGTRGKAALVDTSVYDLSSRDMLIDAIVAPPRPHVGVAADPRPDRRRRSRNAQLVAANGRRWVTSLHYAALAIVAFAVAAGTAGALDEVLQAPSR